jgi:two-component system OmpR family response regulator
MRILVVEDDSILADGIVKALNQGGYTVEHTANGQAADALIGGTEYDTVVLDLGLPELDGLEILRRLRARKNSCPVLILTARDTLEDRIAGLDLGADDYLIKPFKLPELEARIRALIRRRYYTNQTELVVGPLRFDVNNRQVYLNGELSTLSIREMDVLEVLLKNMGQIVNKNIFIDHLCGWKDPVTPNAIEVYISRLRKKLEPEGFQLRTIRGLGYLLENSHER